MVQADASADEKSEQSPYQFGTWQPIDTAPRDETIVLLFYPTAEPDGSECIIEGVYFSSPKEIDDAWETRFGSIGDPSFWMPLPEPPKEG